VLNHNPSPSDDPRFDAELARLLAQHHGAEEADFRAHVRSCPCCSSIGRMISALRSDIAALADDRRAA
jgi:hypothetical protein